MGRGICCRFRRVFLSGWTRRSCSAGCARLGILQRCHDSRPGYLRILKIPEMIFDVAVIVFKLYRYAIEIIGPEIGAQPRYGNRKSLLDLGDLGFVSLPIGDISQHWFVADPTDAGPEKASCSVGITRRYCSECAWKHSSEKMLVA